MGDFRKVCKSDTEDKEEVKDGDNEENIQLTVSVDKWVYCTSNIESTWACSDSTKLPFEFKRTAKEASTTFKFKSYDDKTDQSVIKCYPKTGRTHQIRVHLQSLGHPIAND